MKEYEKSSKDGRIVGHGDMVTPLKKKEVCIFPQSL